jgi:hypothetical protein
MSRGIQRARTDNNHSEIISALRAYGISASSMAAVGNGLPDVVAGFRGVNVLLEIKSGEFPSQRALTVAEKEWHETWGGQVAVVESPEDAVVAVVMACKKFGLV